MDKCYLIWKGNSEDKHPFVVRKNCSGLLKSQQKYPGELSKPFLIGGGYRTSQKWIYKCCAEQILNILFQVEEDRGRPEKSES